MKQFIGELSRREVAFIIIIVLLIVAAGVQAWRISREDNQAAQSIDSFAECVAAGNPVMESYPEQCRAGDRTFTNPDQQSNDPEETTLNMFEIPELGVKFMLPEELSGLYYFVDPAKPNIAYFSLEELRKSDCAADKTAQVALSKLTEMEIEADEQYMQAKEDMKLIDDYYYLVSGGQANCSEDESIQNQASDLRTGVVTAIKETLQAIQ